jgi:hypothetical protein
MTPIRFRKVREDQFAGAEALALRLSIGGVQLRGPHGRSWSPLMKLDAVFSQVEQELSQYPHMREVLVLDEEQRWPRNWPALQE